MSVRNLSIAVSPIDVVSWLANRSKNNKSNAMFSFIIGFGFFISSITRSKKFTVCVPALIELLLEYLHDVLASLWIYYVILLEIIDEVAR